MYSVAATVQPYQLQEQDSESGEETSSGEDEISEGNPVGTIGSSAEELIVGKYAQDGPCQKAALQDTLTGTLSHLLCVFPYSLRSHA